MKLPTLLLLLLSGLGYVHGSGLLYPRPSETRDSGGEILMMPVPSSYNDVTTRADIRDFVGWAWYERTFFVPAAWLQQDSKVRIMLRFGSVHYTAKVWVNSQLAMEHIGGHLPFEADVTSLLHRSANRLTMAVSNVLDSHTIPQGQVERPNDAGRYPPGYIINSYTFDFYNYAGIHRPVVLHAVPNSHVDNILVTSSIQNKQDGIVKFNINIKHDAALSLFCKVRILHNNGSETIVSDSMPAKDCDGSMLVKSAQLWWPVYMSPTPGYLYTLEVSLLDQKHAEPIDVYRLPFGIRTITWTKSQILVNGKPFYFRGVGRHEDLNVRGKGLDLVMLVKDHNLMQWLGANSYRTSHYPYSEENLDLSDRLVVISESPAVNLDEFDEPLLSRHRSVMDELIRRDKNRACVLMWSLANGPRSYKSAAKYYFEKIASYVKHLDPSRPITTATSLPHDEDYSAAFMDVIAINYYSAWYKDAGRLELVTRQMENRIRQWKKSQNKPIFVTEYGADSLAGLHSNPPSLWTEEYQVALMKENFKAFDTLRQQGLLNGEMIWNFADFATAQLYSRVNGNKKGIFTRDRQPKAAAHELRKRYQSLAKTIDQYSVQ
ncbi:hypothetical protein B566_EDAN008761 [Ephemera danica]|nr:hypothetical protein B566_EDAN008761 [Ephemera danica]